MLTALLSIFFGLYLGLWLRHFDSILDHRVELRSPHHNHHHHPHPPHTDTTTSTTTTAFTTTTGVAEKKNKKSSNAVLKDNLSNYWPEGVWNDLIEEGARLQKLNKHKKIIAMEVGMHRAGKENDLHRTFVYY